MEPSSRDPFEEMLRGDVDRALQILLGFLPGTPSPPAAQDAGAELAAAVRLLDERPYLEVVLDGAGLVRSAAGHVADGRWEQACDVLITARRRLIRANARLHSLAQREFRDQ